MKINLYHTRDLVKKYGVLSHVSEKYRQKIMNAGYGRFKLEVAALTKEIERMRKQEKNAKKARALLAGFDDAVSVED